MRGVALVQVINPESRTVRRFIGTLARWAGWTKPMSSLEKTFCQVSLPGVEALPRKDCRHDGGVEPDGSVA